MHAFDPGAFAEHAVQVYDLPSEAQLQEAVSQMELQLTHHVTGPEEAYLYITAQATATVVGNAQQQLSELLQGLHLAFLAPDVQRDWVRKRHYPVLLGSAQYFRSDVVNVGRIRCLVWAATGCGWERPLHPSEASDQPITLDELCDGLQQRHSLPAVVVVVMLYGARKAAQRLAAAGAPRVLWLAESLTADVERSITLLFGVIAPAIEQLAQPRMQSASTAEVESLLLSFGQQCFGGGWHACGCILALASPLPTIRKWTPSLRTRPELGDVWIRNLSASALPDARGHLTRNELHDTLTLYVSDVAGRFDVVNHLTPKAVCNWMTTVLPSNDFQLAEFGLCAALYSDEGQDGKPILQVRILIPSVGFLHELRDDVISGELDKKLSALKVDVADFDFRTNTNYDLRTGAVVQVRTGETSTKLTKELSVVVNKTAFASSYLSCVLALDKLTPHQEHVLRDCIGVQHVHLRAPAGAGKTFIALHRILQHLTSEEGCCLYVALNDALCFFVVRWICKRVRNPLQRRRLLKRLFVQYHDLTVGPRTVSEKQGVIHFTPLSGAAPPFAMVLADEAHQHLFREPELRGVCSSIVQSCQQSVLLSDVSQSVGLQMPFPDASVWDLIERGTCHSYIVHAIAVL